ncbi:hypothetical protein CLV30_11165 [Haloactinopolyspora alba]|uniref:Ester cyclase n=1 Tax=Haloactinopolyspora alba TaxID=648780 RepID=A0A2P8DY01_9ACTN|nr:ester cyclase [Haloactinopolyspora alba]PSL02110.1 hypothetical protein CLV30_11165 [Haloactinopolyspora alba]
MSTAEETANKATFTRVVDACNSHDEELFTATIDEAFRPDLLFTAPAPTEATGAEAIKEVFARLWLAFPDLHISVDDMIAEGDKVVSKHTVTGTHQGEYMGLAPTGGSVTYSEMFMLRFADRRIAETSGVVDVAAQMKQLGLI